VSKRRLPLSTTAGDAVKARLGEGTTKAVCACASLLPTTWIDRCALPHIGMPAHAIGALSWRRAAKVVKAVVSAHSAAPHGPARSEFAALPPLAGDPAPLLPVEEAWVVGVPKSSVEGVQARNDRVKHAVAVDHASARVWKQDLEHVGGGRGGQGRAHGLKRPY